jgi:hypothetical protein
MSIRAFVSSVMIVASCFAISVQAAEPRLRMNKDLFESASTMAADSLLRHCGITKASTILLRFSPGELTALFRPVLLDAVTGHSAAVFTDGTHADTIVTIGVDDVQVQYGGAFRERWFGEKLTERTATASVRIEMQQLSTGKILFAGSLRRSAADTIAVEEIARVSASTRRFAIGEAPEPSMWEKILEPAILTVSSGIAIYLFFSVRS